MTPRRTYLPSINTLACSKAENYFSALEQASLALHNLFIDVRQYYLILTI